jgi:chromosome segregation ATPase
MNAILPAGNLLPPQDLKTRLAKLLIEQIQSELSNSEQIKALQNEVAVLRSSGEVKDSVISDFHEEVGGLKEETHSLEQDKAQLQQQIAEYEALRKSDADRITELLNKLAEYELMEDSKSRIKELLEEAVDDIDNMYDTAENQIDELDSLAGSLSEVKDELEKIKSTSEGLKKSIVHYQRKLAR